MATKPPAPPPRRPLGMSEFAGTIGDQQRPGSGTHILALSRDPAAPPAPQPAAGSAAARAAAQSAAPLQVLSTFDTRKVGSFDWVTTVTTSNAIDPPVLFADVECPDGYTMILRRVELSIFPTFSGSSLNDSITIRLRYDGSAILLNDLSLFGVFDGYGWDTHQVAGQTHSLGVAWSLNGLPASGDLYDIGFRLYGNLIRTWGRPGETEVGSPPLITRS